MADTPNSDEYQASPSGVEDAVVAAPPLGVPLAAQERDGVPAGQALDSDDAVVALDGEDGDQGHLHTGKRTAVSLDTIVPVRLDALVAACALLLNEALRSFDAPAETRGATLVLAIVMLVRRVVRRG